MKIFIVSVLIVSAVAVLFTMIKSGKPVSSLLKSALSGIVSLIAVNVTGLVTGVTLSLNWYTIAAVSVLGLPGAILLTLLKFIFK